MASRFEILPAIDLVAGRIVRLEQGDFARETWYSDDPVVEAVGFAAAGAAWIHVVDLDGARTGEPRHGPTIAAMVAALPEGCAIEVAGGLRTRAAVGVALAMGASRVVVGTAALADPSFARELVEEHGADRIVVAIDIRDGQAVGEGWRAGAASQPAAAVMAVLAEVGVASFEVTAIERDGARSGPDVRLTGSLVAPGRTIIASGGVASIDDLRALRDVGCAGAIVGRALYEGDLDLADAIEAMADA